MLRPLLRACSSVVLCAALSIASSAQTTTSGGFATGYMDVGPTIGIGSIGAAGIAFGGRFERALRTLPDLGNGVLGIQASVDMWNYNDRFGTLDYDFRYIAFGVTANYHFRLEGKPRIDPFLGLGLGNSAVSTDYAGDYSSGLYLIGRAGVRYFHSPRLAFYADAGAGAATLNAGVTFALNGGK